MCVGARYVMVALAELLVSPKSGDWGALCRGEGFEVALEAKRSWGRGEKAGQQVEVWPGRGSRGPEDVVFRTLIPAPLAQ